MFAWASQAAQDLGAALLLCGDLPPGEAKMLRTHGADTGDTVCSEAAADWPDSCLQASLASESASRCHMKGAFAL